MTVIEKHSADAVMRAGAFIRAGEVVVYPTETLYGLGADVFNEAAVRKVVEMKGRGDGKPIPVIISDMDMLKSIADGVEPLAEFLMRAFWPGALTIIFNARKFLPEELTAKTGAVGVRIPSSQIAADLARSAGTPITATSANRSGEQTPAFPDVIPGRLLKPPTMVLDNGASSSSVPSTVVDPRGGTIRILRRGAISEAAIMDAIRTKGGMAN